MSTRTAVTIVGGVIGAYFGYPQLGLMAGALIGGQIDPVQIPGPKIGEIPNQTSADGVNRPRIWGTTWVYGNVIQQGPIIKVEDDSGDGKGGEPEQGPGDRVYRTFAIRIAGPIAGLLRVWQDNKLVFDKRSGSGMIAESDKWMENKVLYLGGESQLPDPNLVAINSDTHAYRGTSYMVFVNEDLTPRGGSISQYRWEVADEVLPPEVGDQTDSMFVDSYIIVTPSQTPVCLHYLEDGNGETTACVGTSIVQLASPSSRYLVHTIDASCTITQTQPIDINWTLFGAESPSVTGLQNLIYGGPSQQFMFAYRDTFPTSVPYIVSGGGPVGSIRPTIGDPDTWFDDNTNNNKFTKRRAWFSQTAFYLGVTQRSGVPMNKMFKFGLGGGFAQATITGVCATPGNEFFAHFGRDQRLRILNDIGSVSTYDADLNLLSTVSLPFDFSGIHGFGFDDEIAVFVYGNVTSGTANRMDVRNSSDLSLISSFNDAKFAQTNNESTRCLFVDGSLFVQCENDVMRYIYSNGVDGKPAILGDIVSDIHFMCGVDSSMYDVSELTDVVDGFSAAGDYTGADVITELRKVYFFDKSEHDKKLYYPKRGLPVVETITIDDMTEVPDRSQREQAVEVPKKLNLKYQHAASGYAPVKSTFSSSSTDVLTQGETSIDTSVVMNEDQAAQTVQKMFKVARTDIGGEMTVSVPMNIGSKYVPGNCLGVSLRGIVTRERIERIDFNGSSYKLSLRPDRQSAYTSDLTGIPIPPPTLPPSTIVGQTELAVLDIAARTETEDDLSYLVAVTGSLPPWYGARYRRSLDGGANYENARDIRVASVMGEITADVAEAPESFTDYTNTVNVILYRDGQLIESITNNQFLSEGGAFALEKADGSWEVMQYRDSVEESDGSFTLSVLHRGQLNSGPSEHLAGARLVVLDRPSHIPASSTWIGQDLTHQAVSLGDSVDDTINAFTETFVGRSQIEWPVASLELTRNVDDVSATWAARYRFGSSNSPVASVNMTGFRVTIYDGSLTDTFDLPLNTPYFTNYDASAFGPSVTVSVQALNRITGAGPATSGAV